MVLIGLACRSFARFGARTKDETTPLPRAAKAVFVGIKTSATPETVETAAVALFKYLQIIVSLVH